MAFSWFFGEDLVLDLGTSNTLIYSVKKDIKTIEPSVVAVDLTNYEIVAVGESAKNMEGKTPDNIITLNPIKSGRIINFEIAEVMVSNLLKKIKSNFSVIHPKIYITISSGISEVDRRAIEDCVIYAGARSVEFVPAAVASAMGMNLPALDPSGSIIVNIGGGTVDVSLVSLGGIVASKFVEIGGDFVDYDIMNIIKNKYDLMIDKETCEYIKISLSSFLTNKITNSLSIFGRDINTGMPRNAVIYGKDITSSLFPLFNAVCDAIKVILEKTPPSMTGNVLKNGVFLTGGCSNISGCVEYIQSQVGVLVNKTENSLSCTCLGAKKLVENKKNIKIKQNRGKIYE
jgi:hypothetical protein